MENVYDKATAYAAKMLDVLGFLLWLIPEAFRQYQFGEWLDTRRMAYPGEPDRRCDTVARFDHREGLFPPEALVIEFKDRARGAPALQQLSDYILRLHREVPIQSGLPDRYVVGGVLVNLTGVQEPRELILCPACLPKSEQSCRPVIRDLATMDAVAEMAQIGRRTTSRVVLPWIPLMQGAGTPDIIQEWVRLCMDEADVRKRSEYIALALIFAELANRSDVWQPSLGGLNMQQSQVVLGWLNQGRAEGRAEAVAILQSKLVRYLQKEFGEIPSDLRARIESQPNLEVLDGWLDQAFAATSLDRFQAALSPA